MEVSAREAGYLLALRELVKSQVQPTKAALARAMGVSAPTALEMIRRLQGLGLLENDRLALSNEGRSAALVLASRRHAVHLLTHDVLGLDRQGDDRDADRLAEKISPALTRRLIAARSRHS